MKHLITIGIPTFRRYEKILTCLDALAKQKLPAEQFRVIVVDNSLEPEKSAAIKKKLKYPYQLDYVITDKCGAAYARNVALKMCNTDIIAYIDDDVYVADNWLESILKIFKKHDGYLGAVSGKINPIWDVQPPKWLTHDVYHHLACLDWGNEELRIDHISNWLVSAAIAYNTKAMLAIGGFPEHLGRKKGSLMAHEELSAHQSLAALGYALVYSPELVVKHHMDADRISYKWFCVNAFWDKISILLYFSGKVIDVAEAGLTPKLQLFLDKKLKGFKEKSTAAELAADMLEFSEQGKLAAESIGLDSSLSMRTHTMPTIYVITTCFNAAATISKTIESVLTQSGDFNLCYHIQDAESSDNTMEIVNTWRKKVQDGSFKPFCRHVVMSVAVEKDAGIYDGVNKAVKNLVIPYYAFMTWINADDILFQGALATISSIQTKHPDVSWVTGQVYATRQNSALSIVVRCAFPQWFIQRGLCEIRYWTNIQQEGTFWRKWLWDRAKGLNAKLKLAGDFDLWMRFAQLTELWHFPGPLASFHRRSGQLSEDADSYAREVDALVSKEQKDQDWETISNALIDNPAGFDFNCLFYDWSIDAYKMIKLPLQGYIPFWKEYELSLLAAQKGKTQSHAVPGSTAPHAESAPGVSDYAVETPVPVPPPKPKPLAQYHAGCEWRARKSRLSRLSGQIRGWRGKWKAYKTLRRSGLFWDDYYLGLNPDVGRLGIDPLMHYIRHGAQEGRNPNPVFSTYYYLRHNQDVKEAGINPLLHYWLHGAKEGRNPSEQFNTGRYLENHPELRRSGKNPLVHYLLTAIHSAVTEVSATVVAETRTTATVGALAVASPLKAIEPLPPTLSLTPEGFSDFTYSRHCHLPLLGIYASELYNREITDWSDENIKIYQDLLAYAFIRQNVPAGCRILIINGNHHELMQRLTTEFNCEQVDPDVAGSLSALQSGHFDFALSIGTMLRKNSVEGKVLRECATNILRSLKSGGHLLSLFDIVAFTDNIWQPPIISELTSLAPPLYPPPPPADIAADPHLFYMSEKAYNNSWKAVIGKEYNDFGRPASANILMTKSRNFAT